MKNDIGNEVIVKAATKSLHEGDDSQVELRALTAHMDEDDQRMVFMGASNFSQLCATCHGPDGKGIPSKLAPPLAGAALVKGNKDVLIRVLLHGLRGPVDNIKYPDIMQPQAAHDDGYISSVLSFIRVSLGNQGGHGGLIFPEDVKNVRDATASRMQPWTIEELNAVDKAAGEKNKK